MQSDGAAQGARREAPHAGIPRQFKLPQLAATLKLIAKEGGIKGRVIPSVWLKPDSILAMNGNLHPITEIGLEYAGPDPRSDGRGA